MLRIRNVTNLDDLGDLLFQLSFIIDKGDMEITGYTRESSRYPKTLRARPYAPQICRIRFRWPDIALFVISLSGAPNLRLCRPL